MKSFKKYSGESALWEKDKEEPQSQKEPEEPKSNTDDEEISDIGSWKKVLAGWLVHFKVGGKSYTASFSPLDDAELHWKFVYFLEGQRDSSDPMKFGSQEEWISIWNILNSILKDFIRIFRPSTMKFIGMTISKRGSYYRDFFKMYVKNYLYVFRKLGYYTSFDYRDLHRAPSFVIKKGEIKKDTEEKLQETLDIDYKLVSQRTDRNVYKGEWIQPEKLRAKDDNGKYVAIKVEFVDSKKQYDGCAMEGRFKEEEEGLKWARTVKKPASIPDDYTKKTG